MANRTSKSGKGTWEKPQIEDSSEKKICVSNEREVVRRKRLQIAGQLRALSQQRTDTQSTTKIEPTKRAEIDELVQGYLSGDNPSGDNSNASEIANKRSPEEIEAIKRACLDFLKED
ncbi:hypothetical protein KAR91_04435 [Candidatus Pacearchaeota archaeon]|nr:hypothetical protein [Candidatus Pacearchaeota archaeon]